MVRNKILTAMLALLLTLSLVMTACAEDALTAIMQAGTTQAFTDEAVAEEDLTKILEVGLAATSAMNQQPWYFAVVTNQEVMEELAAGMSFGGAATTGMTPLEGFEAPENMPAAGEMPAAPATSGTAKAGMGDSPVAIVIYMNEESSSTNPSFDCGLACQNMVIAAASLGYGTKIISSPTMALNGTEHDALCEKLGVDPAMNAVAVLLVGKADTAADVATNPSVRNSIEEKVSFVD